MCFILRILHIKRLGTGCYVICSSLPLHCSAIPTTLLCHIVIAYCLLDSSHASALSTVHYALHWVYAIAMAVVVPVVVLVLVLLLDLCSALLRSGTSIGTAAQLLSLTSEKEKEPEIVNLHIKYFWWIFSVAREEQTRQSWHTSDQWSIRCELNSLRACFARSLSRLSRLFYFRSSHCVSVSFDANRARLIPAQVRQRHMSYGLVDSHLINNQTSKRFVNKIHVWLEIKH